MKKVYIARRIPKQPRSEFVLNIKKEMEPEEIFKAYVQKTKTCELYIYNGPWVLRPPLSDDVFTVNNIPLKLTPVHVWGMVKEKIESSNVFLGVVNKKSYGTIAEIGYACKCKNVAVYVLPDFGITNEELQDLWFTFQMATETQYLWCDEDINMLEDFSNMNIFSVAQYESYLSEIVPNFMKK